MNFNEWLSSKQQEYRVKVDKSKNDVKLSVTHGEVSMYVRDIHVNEEIGFFINEVREAYLKFSTAEGEVK